MLSYSFKSIVAAAVIGATLVAGQNTSQADVDSGIATVLTSLQGTHLIPNLLPASSFQLKALLTQTFGNTAVNTGELVPVTEVANAPRWTLQYASPQNFTGTRFTVMTVDPSAASDQSRNIVRHYLANNLTLSAREGNVLQNLTLPVAGWFSPAPPAGTGVHRYTTLVFAQPSNFSAPANETQRNTTINTNFDLPSYVQQANLGSVVAANFFLAQNADTTASTTATGVLQTSSVPAASVSAVQSSVSRSLATATQTGGSTSASSTGTATNAAVATTSVSTGGVALALVAMAAASAVFL